jgi:hypothetical protein
VSAAAPSPWLVSRRTDLLLFGGSALLSVAFLAAGRAAGILDGSLPPALWLLLVVGVDVAHVWSTGWRVYADGEEFRRREALYLAIPAGALAAGILAHSISPHLFWRLLAYAAVFHFVRQQYGWVALYRRKNGEEDEPGRAFGRRLDALTIYGATVAPLLWWHARLPRRFHWFLEGDFAAGLPAAVGPAAMALFGVVLVVYGVKEAVRVHRGARVSWGKNLVVATTVLTWNLGIVVFDSDYAFSVSNVLVHGIPYLGIVLHTSRQRRREREARGMRLTLTDRAAGNAALFVAPLLLLAFLEEWGWDRFVWHEYPAFFPGDAIDLGRVALSVLVPLLALPQATHYLLDGWIWRMKDNTDAARALGVPG